MRSSGNKGMGQSYATHGESRSELNQPFYNYFRGPKQMGPSTHQKHWRHLIESGFGEKLHIPTTQLLALSFHHPLERELALQCIALSSGRMDILEFCQPINFLQKTDIKVIPVRCSPWPKHSLEERCLSILENIHISSKDRSESIERILRDKISHVNINSAVSTLDYGFAYPNTQAQLQILENEGFRFIYTPQLGPRLRLGLHPDTMHIDLGYYEQRPAHHLQFQISLMLESLRSPFADFLNLYEDRIYRRYILSKLRVQLRRQDGEKALSTPNFRLESRRETPWPLQPIDESILQTLKESLEIDLLILQVFKTGRLLNLVEAIADVKLAAMQSTEIRQLTKQHHLISRLIQELSRTQITTHQKAS